MKLPRFSFRELLMLMAIIALLTPYFLPRGLGSRFDLSSPTVQKILMTIEPAATIKFASDEGGRLELTCLIPADAGYESERRAMLMVDGIFQKQKVTFFEKLGDAIEEHIREAGWHIPVSTSAGPDNFRFLVGTGWTQCEVFGFLVSRKKGKDLFYDRDVDEVRFIIVSAHTR